MARRVAVSCVSGLVLLGAPGASVPARPSNAAAPPPPPPVPREFRGAWMSPVDGSDWPSRPGLDAATQQAELRALLDRARAIGLNAIILHVRPAADAFYPTPLAPWSSYLVGNDSAPAPGYDPLAFAIREAHARGLQLHVWFNPFRAAPPNGDAAPRPDDIRRTHPEWIRQYGDVTWIDPGIPAARQAVLDAILDVVQRYDIDGVHLDDYFYPYLEDRIVTRWVGRGRHRHRVRRTVTLRFPDEGSWSRYGVAAGWTDRADWRRANISDFVHTLYVAVKARKPWVLVGISPFGIWRPGHPAGITGLDAYAEIFADSREWLRRGWVDYLAPQLYWPLDGDEHRFQRLDAWWRGENPMHRHVWPGLLTMGVASGRDPWPDREIPDEIAALRAARARTGESLGELHFRLRTLVSDDGALGNLLEHTSYRTVALPPASPWLGPARPAPPEVTPTAPLPTPFGLLAGGDGTVAVSAVGTVPVRWWVVQTRGTAGGWTTAIVPGDSARIHVTDGVDSPTAVAVSAVSPTGVLGAPTVVRYTAPTVLPYVSVPAPRSRDTPGDAPTGSAGTDTGEAVAVGR